MKTNCLKNSRHFSFSQLHIENTSNANIYIYSTFNNLKLYSLEHAFIQSNNCSNQIQIFNFQQETIQSISKNHFSNSLHHIHIYTYTPKKQTSNYNPFYSTCDKNRFSPSYHHSVTLAKTETVVEGVANSLGSF